MTQTTSKATASGLDSEQDRPFNVATFQCSTIPVGNAARQEEEEEDMPSNLIASRSNVPGMTPQELMAAHRMSLAEISHKTDTDLHSLTLSRHQVEPGDVYQASMGDIPDDEYNDALKSFKFGDDADE